MNKMHPNNEGTPHYGFIQQSVRLQLTSTKVMIEISKPFLANQKSSKNILMTELLS